MSLKKAWFPLVVGILYAVPSGASIRLSAGNTWSPASVPNHYSHGGESFPLRPHARKNLPGEALQVRQGLAKQLRQLVLSELGSAPDSIKISIGEALIEAQVKSGEIARPGYCARFLSFWSSSGKLAAYKAFQTEVADGVEKWVLTVAEPDTESDSGRLYFDPRPISAVLKTVEPGYREKVGVIVDYDYPWILRAAEVGYGHAFQFLRETAGKPWNPRKRFLAALTQSEPKAHASGLLDLIVKLALLPSSGGFNADVLQRPDFRVDRVMACLSGFFGWDYFERSCHRFREAPLVTLARAALLPEFSHEPFGATATTTLSGEYFPSGRPREVQRKSALRSLTEPIGLYFIDDLGLYLATYRYYRSESRSYGYDW